MKKRFLYLMLPIITLALQILPYGAVCNFANPEGKVWRKTYSYFDLTPFGYANFAPLITAIITCVIVVLLLIFLFTNTHGFVTAIKVLLCVGIVVSLCPLFYGISFFSVVGALITLCLMGELFLLLFSTRQLYGK